jgi:hypothetical protein
MTGFRFNTYTPEQAEAMLLEELEHITTGLLPLAVKYIPPVEDPSHAAVRDYLLSLDALVDEVGRYVESADVEYVGAINGVLDINDYLSLPQGQDVSAVYAALRAKPEWVELQKRAVDVLVAGAIPRLRELQKQHGVKDVVLEEFGEQIEATFKERATRPR